MSPWLVSIVFWLPRAWNRLTHRYYYGRLTYQYELGLAHGRRDVLRNFDTYRDLSQAEIDAITQDPDHN
jgi:hypothetical protein